MLNKHNIYSIKNNIIRYKTGSKENEFSLISADVIKTKEFDNSDSIFSIENKGECIFYGLIGKGQLFVQNEVVFEQVDVVRTSCETAPEIETVKTVDGQRTFIKNLTDKIERKSNRIVLDFLFEENEMLFGMGQDEEGILNKRGTKQYLYQHNMIIPIPFIVSDKGYGILFDASCLMEFDDTGSTTKIIFDTLDSLDYYVIAGSMDEIISGYRHLTGKAAMLPKWAFGYLQSKERYKTADELTHVVAEYRKRKIPLDGIIQDWKTWEGDLWGEKIVDKSRFPDLKEMNDKIHEMNVHTMVSVWPNMNVGGENHSEFAREGLLLNDYSTYDAFQERARRIYWRQIQKELYSGGYDAWWCDSTEPFTAADWCGFPKKSDEERFKTVGAEHKKYLDPTKANAYALMHAMGIYENQRKCSSDKRVFNLIRSGYPGIQKYGTVLWAGDTSASWGELKKEIAKGISVGLSGIPYWTVDIGAFFVGGLDCWRKWKEDENAAPVWFWDGNYDAGVEDDRYKELYVRWLQFGAFLPIFRSHGTDTPREIWNFGEEGTPYYDAIKKAIELRYQLIEYIYSMAARVTFDDYTIIRSLLFDFSDDSNAKEISTEFMFGDSLLVCPVISAMNEKKETLCYLPQGANWIDFWTGEFFEGGKHISKPSKLNEIPLFIKQGSIVPIKKGIQYVNQDSDVIELHIYGGNDCSFKLYTDSGDGYGYEKGEFSILDICWKDSERVLTAEGIGSEKINVTLNAICDGKSHLINYRNEKICVHF